MTLFIILAILIIGITVTVITWVFIKKVPAPEISRADSNLAILQENLLTLEKDFAVGLITQEQFSFQKNELEQRTVEEVLQLEKSSEKNSSTTESGQWLPYAFIGIIPLFVVGLYLMLGNPGAIFIKKDPQAQQIEEMVQQLEDKLKKEPNNAEGWMFLGRSYAAMNRLVEARMAYQKAIRLDPQNDRLMADLADLIAFQQKSISGEALNYIEQALKINPKNPKALALRGSAAFDQKNYASAIKDWKLAITALDPKDQEFIAGLQDSISEAQAKLKPGSSPANPINVSQVSGTVLISEALRSKISPQDTVFIYAKALNGPKMPLAIVRVQAKDLPYTFVLNDSQAMSPQMTLSKFKEFSIHARVSKSGNALPQEGDLIGQIDKVTLGAKQLQLIINRVQPKGE
jgi:cytochrome c-type biogenesis protein CcmH